MVIGGSVMYFIEDSPNTDFSSIPNAIWWAIVTVTSVGYGDVVPLTYFGQLFTTCYLIFGVFTIFLPILSLVNNFMNIYMTNYD